MPVVAGSRVRFTIDLVPVVACALAALCVTPGIAAAAPADAVADSAFSTLDNASTGHAELESSRPTASTVEAGDPAPREPEPPPAVSDAPREDAALLVRTPPPAADVLTATTEEATAPRRDALPPSTDGPSTPTGMLDEADPLVRNAPSAATDAADPRRDEVTLRTSAPVPLGDVPADRLGSGADIAAAVPDPLESAADAQTTATDALTQLTDPVRQLAPAADPPTPPTDALGRATAALGPAIDSTRSVTDALATVVPTSRALPAPTDEAAALAETLDPLAATDVSPSTGAPDAPPAVAGGTAVTHRAAPVGGSSDGGSLRTGAAAPGTDGGPPTGGAPARVGDEVVAARDVVAPAAELVSTPAAGRANEAGGLMAGRRVGSIDDADGVLTGTSRSRIPAAPATTAGESAVPVTRGANAIVAPDAPRPATSGAAVGAPVGDGPPVGPSVPPPAGAAGIGVSGSSGGFGEFAVVLATLIFAALFLTAFREVPAMVPRAAFASVSERPG